MSKGHQQAEACWFFFLSMLIYLGVMLMSFNSSSIFFWSLLVYPMGMPTNASSLTIYFFEFVSLSGACFIGHGFFWVFSFVQWTRRWILTCRHFFFRIASLWPFCVCLLLHVGRHVLLFLVFLCCYLQRRETWTIIT